MKEIYAGLFSGIISTIIVNPLDVLRTHKQLNIKYNISVKFLYNGLTPALICLPSFWAIYFPTYEYLKKQKFNLFSGYLAANIGSTFTCPLFFIRQKYQIDNTIDIYKYYKLNGIKPFYNALITTYLYNTSLIFQMPIYEHLKKKYLNLTKIDTLNIFIITSISKIISTLIVYPIDTLRTIKRQKTNKSLFEIIYNLNKNPNNYYRGISIYLLRSIPYHGSIFCSYEFFKKK